MPSDPLITQLRLLAQSTPDLKPAAQLYEIILPLLRDADLHVESIALTEQRAREKLAQAIPLLQDENLVFDHCAARDLIIRLARALEKSTRGAKTIREAFEKNRIEIDALLPSLLAEDRAIVGQVAQRSGVDEGLLWTLALNAVKPAFRAWARHLSSLIKEGRGDPEPKRSWGDWERGNCPICGAIPLLSELQGNDQARHLRCGRCSADWEYRRLACLYCGNDNAKTLCQLYTETLHEKMHVQVCDQCKGYVKVINAFSPNPPEMLAVQDLATLHLDFIAREKGYARIQIKV